MSKNQQFQKFITYKSNAAKKESFKQEKRLAKKERAAAIDKRFEEKRLKKSGAPLNDSSEEPIRKPAKNIARSAVKPATAPATIAPASQAKTSAPGTAIRKKTAVKTPKPGSLEEKKLLAAKAAGHPLSSTVPVAVNSSASSKPIADKRPSPSDSMPLNKFVAHAGICSRRDAADLIRQGEVRINDVVVTEPGTKVSPRDNISFKGKKITPSKNLVYILLNKPKDYITTLDDPEGRKTVLDLIRPATTERVYPVGRLDRNTSGVLLITNDGDLAQTLSHPKNLIKKIYEVRLDRALTKADFDKLLHGIELEDGFIAPDALGYTDPKDKTIIGIEIHSGRNRIVRRVFEYLGYDVRNLDRVMYAGLTKKNVQRGKWRFLTEKEVRILRHFNPQTKTDKVKKPVPAPTHQPTKK